MKYLLYWLLIIQTSCSIAQPKKEQNSGTILLDPDFTGKISLYENISMSKITAMVNNNIDEEDFVYFVINGSTKDLYHVKAYYFIAGYINEGWISKINALGIYVKPHDRAIPIYRESNDLSPTVATIPKNSNFIKVLDCNNSWLKIETSYEGTNINGWLEKKYQCDNPYNSCN